MSGVRLILALHNHQPVGNFDGVFEAAYRDSYLPFLEVMEDYPAIPFALHTSGPLLEWLVEHRPEYVERVRDLVDAGRVEILGGGFYEPIMTMIPHRDRVGQIAGYSAYLNQVFGATVRGMWIPERVWEQHLVSSIAAAGIEYTILDDYHFLRSGLRDRQLFGYYLTEDEGRLLKVFPGSEPLRFMIPFHEPHSSYEYLRRLADERPGATVVFADDGEKFGAWPETFEHVYTRGWLRRFCDMIVANREWLEPITFSRAVDETLPLGKVYLSDCSYREMTEWVLPADHQAEYQRTVKETAHEPAAQRLRPFVRAGGFWRNFKARYAESDEMYSRMLGLSRRLAETEDESESETDNGGQVDPDYLEAARQELYRAQCNCPYWHGAFGGLYLPHLRNAVYRGLIAAHNALDEAEGKTGPRVALEVGDFNLDARQEVRLENDRLVALVRPASGGHLYELDDRRTLTNVLATLDRRPEAYHAAIAASAESGGGHYDGPAVIQDRIILKQEGLERLLVYDGHPRKALVDHFYPADVTLDDLARCAEVERGDFVTGAYLSRVQRSATRVALLMDRAGVADGHAIHVRKSIELTAGASRLEVHYVLEDLPPDAPLHFAVEMNFAAMAGHADDRYLLGPSGERLGMLDSRLDLAPANSLALCDEWLDLAVRLHWSTPAGVWCFPIETVSQSEGGFEGVYQSTAVIPHWVIVAGPSRRWEVRIGCTLDSARPAPTPTPAAETTEPSRAGGRTQVAGSP
jgi:alpha-amylase